MLYKKPGKAMWNNQLSTLNSKTLIDYARWQGSNDIIPDANRYGAPNGEDLLPSKIKIMDSNDKPMSNRSRGPMLVPCRGMPVTWNDTRVLQGVIDVFP